MSDKLLIIKTKFLQLLKFYNEQWRKNSIFLKKSRVLEEILLQYKQTKRNALKY